MPSDDMPDEPLGEGGDTYYAGGKKVNEAVSKEK